ncbi:Na+:solute symporter [candidate division KSB1 bacterium]|nr:Na+:solute symporter [candidate division KSB1 bacterium]
MNSTPAAILFRPELMWYDWLIIGLYMLFSIAIGLWYSRRGTRSINEYFASGRDVPWWILGTSMVATTFAADTPLAISGLVVKQGIWGNWFWWSQIPMFVGGVYFFSRLWRRTRVLTDTEFVALRYSGRSSKILRGFRALYFSLPYDVLIMGWVILSMTKIMGLTFNIDKDWAIIISLAITLAYTAVSGLWGVLITDFFQFFLAMGMAIYLAIVSVNYAGGLGVILSKIETLYGAEKAASMTAVIPPVSDPSALTIFLIYIFLLWWTVGNTDGGAYFAQRMIAAKDEKHSFLGYLWFNVAHFCLRPWPWILVGLVAAVEFPNIINPHTQKADPEIGYIAVMLKYLKPGLLGLMLSSFLAAFMSTISAQINWGASYLINDFYRPFIKQNATEKHYVRVSIGTTIFLCLLGGIMARVMEDIFTAWLLLSAINGGIGIVYIARWYWWRVNAWSEMSAIISVLVVIALIIFSPLFTFATAWGFTPDAFLQLLLLIIVSLTLLVLLIFGFGKSAWRKENGALGIFILLLGGFTSWLLLTYQLPEKAFPWTILFTVPISSLVWLTTTLLTPPVAAEQLIEFYQRVHPGGPGWRQVIERYHLQPSEFVLFTPKNFIGAGFSILAVMGTLLALWQLFLGSVPVGIGILAGVGLCTVIVIRNLSHEKWESA